ncbi:hypothetical protein COL154_011129 [Colletotrichum chrysophilum]|uniref:Secreted protein NIS1 n=1 Tax=Colletotrichum chrysophilum TaxID=1836956 RepID=A0AAD9AM46_9PEZI|nr:uncharacterized protein COL26b_009221 [Colletotrichum chrysophilum]KAJ0347649.1 hypothetical protein KNSL1_006256 [Colletotrichum chrysophilum]KAJ0356128.1 hypothetical protein COL154_011129 [Colletotrichum chrysophilum]KAJ0372181.1 hypothetical protein COL26b_009221 [Colletotrichum chrysophilum]KAK1851018.1 hypothetical protein CCHR01_06342 [Colletotrichum chrysophilum]
MQFRASIAAAASLFALANARIYGIAFPETVKAGDQVNAIIETENYIQSVQDVAIAFGIAPEASAYPGTLSTVIGSFYLGPEKSNVLDNITETVTIPGELAAGTYVVSAGVYSLYGASSSTTLTNYNVTITVGDATSENYVGSQ